MLATLALTVVTAIVTAVFFGLWTALAISLVAAFAQELGKLALDAIVQREIGEEVRSSTFGVVEAVLQLAWVFGGLVGLVLSLTESSLAGLVTLAVLLTAALGWLLVLRRRRVRATKAELRRRRAEAPAPSGAPSGAATAHAEPGPHRETAAPEEDSAYDEPTPYDQTVPYDELRGGEEPPRKEKIDPTKPLTNPNG
ncbi:hypothetical protein GCM10020220_010040 [Nonomuraea rubra]